MGDFVAAHAGQTDVEEHDFRAEILRRLQGLRAVVRHADVMAPGFQQHRRGFRGVDVIVDDEHASRLLRGRRGRYAAGARRRSRLHER